jgi:hypothetical protein
VAACPRNGERLSAALPAAARLIAIEAKLLRLADTKLTLAAVGDAALILLKVHFRACKVMSFDKPGCAARVELLNALP